MNKYQRALDELIECAYGSLEKERARHLCIVEDLQELVDRTIPAKAEIKLEVRPEYGENGAYADADIITNYHCPRCGAWITSEYGLSSEEELIAICSGCGQAIQGVENE